MKLCQILLFMLVFLNIVTSVMAIVEEDEPQITIKKFEIRQEENILKSNDQGNKIIPQKEITTKSQPIPQKEIVKTIKGEVIEVDHDKKSVTVKEYLESRGLMFDSTVFDRATLYFDDNTEFQGGYSFKDYYQIHHGQLIDAKYKKNKVGENIIIKIKPMKELQ